MSGLLQAFARGDPRAMLGILVLLSIVMSVVGSNLAWHYRFGPGGRLSAYLRRLSASTMVHALYEVFRLTYYVGIPYAALYLGWVDLRSMGLGFLDWPTGMRWAIVLTLAAWSLLMFVWVPYLRATSHIPVIWKQEWLAWPRRVVEIVYMQANWAFYRAASILILTTLLRDDLAVYWGTGAGIGFIMIEAWADPRVRRHLAQFGQAEPALWSTGQAIINSVGFILTRNSWLLVLTHLALEFSVPHLRTVPRPPLPRSHPAGATNANPALK